MNEIILAVLGSGALSALISGCFAIYTNKKALDNKVTKALQLLMLCQLEQNAEKYSKKEEISLRELKQWEEMYTTYHDLGGNGYAESLKDIVEGLPIK